MRGMEYALHDLDKLERTSMISSQRAIDTYKTALSQA